MKLFVPYSFLYPSIIMFCVVGVYAVNGSVVDVWIALIMGEAARAGVADSDFKSAMDKLEPPITFK